MSQLLTRSEHIARALLMGRVYDWRDGTYCLTDADGDPEVLGMVDCVTLEVIDNNDDDAVARYTHLRLRQASSWNRYDEGNGCMPWEAPDDPA